MKACLMVLVSLVLAWGISEATTIHVPGDQPTIQAGIDAASVGDTVLVACGTYTWGSESPAGSDALIHIAPGVSLQGDIGGGGCVTIDAQNQGRILYGESLTNDASIDGIVFTNGYANDDVDCPDDWGGAMFLSNSQIRVNDCVFQSNASINVAGGVCVYGSRVVFTDCKFIANEANGLGAGGGVYCRESEPEFVGCTFVENVAVNAGAAYIVDCYSAQFRKCTFANNTAQDSGSAIRYHLTFVLLEDCIIAMNGPTSPVYSHMDEFEWITCTNVFGNEGGDWVGVIAEHEGMNGNISLDPYFCDPNMGDFGLHSDSPCAPDNNDCGVLMGAWPVGCSTSTESLTWSSLKAIF